MLNENDLLPEEQDNPGLIKELRATYRLKPEEQQALARVHERLSHGSHSLPPFDAVRFDDLSRSPQRATPAELSARTAGFRRRWLTRLNTLAAAILVVILVGSLVLTLSFTHHTTVGSPPSNDLHLLLEPVKGSDPSQATMQFVSEVLSQRFSSFGLSGTSVNILTLAGHLAVQVALPHFGGNEQQTIETLVQTGNLEFWNTGSTPVQLGSTFDPTQYTTYNPGNKPEFTGKDLDASQVYVSYDSAGRPQISFEMKGDAIGRFGSFTANNIGAYLTITFDRKVIESASINSAITGPGVIAGQFTQQQANAISADLKAGSLPVALMMVG
jgi:hypothetical protein